MFLPTQLLPSAIGLRWGMSVTECSGVLPAAPTYSNSYQIQVPLHIDAKPYDVELFFADPANPETHQWYDIQANRHDWVQGSMWDRNGKLVVEPSKSRRSGLFRIQTNLYASRTFWVENSGPEDTDLARTRIWSEYRDKYEKLVKQYSKVLGLPTFSGSREIMDKTKGEALNRGTRILNPEFPIEQWEDHLTYWTHKEGRLQLGLFQSDKELPVTITLACYQPPNSD